MKSFKQYITEKNKHRSYIPAPEPEKIYPPAFLKNKVLMDLVKTHKDPLKFLLAVVDQMNRGKLKLQRIGAATTREVAALWNDHNGKKIPANMIESFEKSLNEVIKVPIKVGDTVLGGKFKNKRIVVKSIGKNEKGDITINGRPLLKYRIP